MTCDQANIICVKGCWQHQLEKWKCWLGFSESNRLKIVAMHNAAVFCWSNHVQQDSGFKNGTGDQCGWFGACSYLGMWQSCLTSSIGRHKVCLFLLELLLCGLSKVILFFYLNILECNISIPSPPLCASFARSFSWHKKSKIAHSASIDPTLACAARLHFWIGGGIH